jgi:hypothetical protein
VIKMYSVGEAHGCRCWKVVGDLGKQVE